MSGVEVSSSVWSIITSFKTGLAVVGKLHAKQKHKTSAAKSRAASHYSQLCQSLKRGPAEIQREYDRGVAEHRHRFEAGDCEAEALLARTLLKLSSLTSFLMACHNPQQLNYELLRHLSDATRVETVETLGTLRRRLSRPAVKNQPTRYANMSSGNMAAGASSKASNGSSTPKTAGSKASGATIARVPGKNPNQTQWAVIRPRPKHQRSSGSSSSSSSKASATSTASKASTSSTAPTTPASTSTSDSLGFPNQQTGRPRTVPQSSNAAIQQVQRPHVGPSRPPLDPVSDHGHDNNVQPVPRRRAVATPSFYSIASDSTKLGEIPMHKWIHPFDFEAQERINADGWMMGPKPQKEQARKKGLFTRVFRRSSMNDITE